MEITPVNTWSSTTATQSSTSDADLFMELLVTQLQNQSPLQPMEDGELSEQLASMSSMEQQQALNDNLEDLIAIQVYNARADGLDTASSFVGRSVSYADGVGGEHSGTVTHAGIDDLGDVYLQIGDDQVPLGNLRTIGS